MKDSSGKGGEGLMPPFTTGIRRAGLGEPIIVGPEAGLDRGNSLESPLYYMAADMFMHACK